ELSETRTYTVSVSNIRDQAASPNTIAPDSQATFSFDGWDSQDVGGPLAAGSSSYSAGTYTIQADGNDIFSNSDQFHFVYRTLDGDGEIICRVVSIPDMWAAKGGVMMRDNLNGDSPEVSMVLGGQVSEAWFQWRTTTGGSTGYEGASSSIDAPYYVRVVRDDGVFSGYISPTGQPGSWTQVDTGKTVSDMTSGTVYVGLCASSHESGTLGTFVMDNVQLIEYDAPANTAPTAAADSYLVTRNSTLSAAPGEGVLVNDSDAESDSLSAALIGDVSDGALTLNGNGSFDYTPDTDFVGTDSFTYQAGDGELSSGTTTVSIRVAIPGDANLDDLVDTQDFTILKANLGQGGVWGDGDFNRDGLVDTQDFTILKAYLGQSASSGGQGLGSTDLSAAAPAGSQTTEQLPWPAIPSARPQAAGRPRRGRPAQPQENLVEWIKPVTGLELPAETAGGFVDLPAAVTFALPADDAGTAESDGSSLAINLDPGLLDALSAARRQTAISF
ncbi:MAG: Ig-like domain-containing protein, partial [Planctomycetota bacterium]